MQLIIAEKKSVGEHIAKLLGATHKEKNHMEGNGYLVAWCVGHLVTYAPADHYNPNFQKWNVADLPIIPEDFKLIPIKGKEHHLEYLAELMERPDVKTIINACDAGREGELIFGLVYQWAKIGKVVQRLWVSSMEDSAMLEGFQKMRDGTEMNHLLSAAQCRAKADWIMGINATRLFSCLYNQSLNVGRVISPTLAMIVHRNEEITSFKQIPFYTAEVQCKGMTFLSDRLDSKVDARNKLEPFETEEIVVEKLETQEKRKKPPLLYDLTSLQREANRLLGFSAQQTLDYTQALYERKVLTYPRTDSAYLTEDMSETLKKVLDFSMNKLEFSGESPKEWNNVLDNSKVTDHHAIIPTLNLEQLDLTKLNYGECQILELVMSRTLKAVSHSHRYQDTLVTIRCGEVHLSAKIETILDKGYLVFDKFAPTKRKQEDSVPLLKEGDVLTYENSKVKEGRTTPPKQYTEDTILYAMERTGIDENAEFCGIGTAATRAAVLEKLVNVGLVERHGDSKTKFLLPTAKGHALIAVLPDSVQSPIMTSEWEKKLKSVELGEFSPDIFLEEVSAFVRNLVETYEKALNSDVPFPDTTEVIGTCPRCGKNVITTPKAFSCADRDCGFVLWKDNKFFTSKRKKLTETVAKELLSKGKTFLRDCYSEKNQSHYDCTVFLEDTGEKYVNFRIEFDNKHKGGQRNG